MGERVEFEINGKLYEVLERRADEKGFETVEDYIKDILGQVVERIRRESGNGMSEEEEEEVKQRLKSLGYR